MTNITNINNITSLQNTQFNQAVDLLSQANSVCILTGAGISAESGIPTFRDKQTGLWEQYRAEDLANVQAFQRDPQLVWSWYQWRRNMVHDKQPNLAHHAIARWQQALTQTKEQTKTQAKTSNKTGITRQIQLITQNVDDLHEQTGSQVTHLHGHLWKNRCAACDTIYTEKVDYTNNEVLSCPLCGGYIRPDIVWFGESLPVTAWQYAEQSAVGCDVFMSIGTSSVVYPAAGLASLAKQSGASIIEVNPNPTQHPMVDVVLADKAGVVLPKLVDTILQAQL